MSALELASFLPLLPSWSLVEVDGIKQLCSTFAFHSDELADSFVERLTAKAEAESHPVHIERNDRQITVRCYTESLHGLHPNDFLMAARADGLWSQLLVGREGLMTVPGRLPTLAESPRFRKVMPKSRLKNAKEV